jgi:phospholipase C
VLDIPVSNPKVFSKTVFIINYDEADGSFDHVVPPSPPPAFPASPDTGASTVDYHNEIVTTSTPNGPIGLGSRVPAIVISPWSKGGYVNSQVFDHTSTIQFIEKRFGVFERNISPWRRAVCGDLTSAFNFENPNEDRDEHRVKLPSTDGFLPSVSELSGTGRPPTLVPTKDGVIIGVPAQEKGVRPARALPYEVDVHSTVQPSNSTVTLQFVNSGKQGAVRVLGRGGQAEGKFSREQFHGWYDLIITVAQDPNFEYRLAGHVETGRDSISDPAMGGLLTQKA